MPETHHHSIKMTVPYWEQISGGVILKTALSIWKCEGCGRSGWPRHFFPESGVEEVFVFPVSSCLVVLNVDSPPYRGEHVCYLPEGHQEAHNDGVITWIGGTSL